MGFQVSTFRKQHPTSIYGHITYDKDSSGGMSLDT